MGKMTDNIRNLKTNELHAIILATPDVVYSGMDAEDKIVRRAVHETIGAMYDIAKRV